MENLNEEIVRRSEYADYHSSFNRRRRRKIQQFKRNCLRVAIIAMLIIVAALMIMNIGDIHFADITKGEVYAAKPIIEEHFIPTSKYRQQAIDDDYKYEREFMEALLEENSEPKDYPVKLKVGKDGMVKTNLIEEWDWTEEDLEYLIMCLTGECQTFSEEDQILIGSVVLNRVTDPDYPYFTVKDVCLAPGQYSCFKEGGGAYRKPTQATINAANFLINNGSQIPSNVFYQAQFKQGSGVYMVIDNEYLCYK